MPVPDPNGFTLCCPRDSSILSQQPLSNSRCSICNPTPLFIP